MKFLKKSLMVLGVVILTNSLLAQSLDEANEKYNEGKTFYTEKQYSSAVSSYEEALDIANAIGPDGEELSGLINKALLQSYYRNGISLYKGRKYDGSIASFEKGLALSQDLNDSEMEEKLITLIAKVRSTKGNSLIKKGLLDEAFAEYEMGLEIKPNCVNAFYGKGLVYREKGDLTKMMVNMDEAIKFGAENPKAAKTVAKAKKMAAKRLIDEAKREIQKEHGKEAINYINYSFKYSSGNAEVFYLLANAYNKTKQFSEAINSANKALELEGGDKSNIYFELGLALEGKGDASGACNAYKKVTGGDNAEAAKYQIEQVLKCG